MRYIIKLKDKNNINDFKMIGKILFKSEILPIIGVEFDDDFDEIILRNMDNVIDFAESKYGDFSKC